MISTREIPYQVGSDSFTGFLAVNNDANEAKPAVIVVHEWWGHDDYVRTRAEQLAGDGMVAFAIDLYGDGKVAHSPDEAGQLMNKVVNQPGAIEQRFDAALDVLTKQAEVDPSNVSAIGYCFGGAVVLNMARAGRPLRVVGSFHGLLETQSPLQAGHFDGKIAVFNGADDPMVSPEIVAGFEQEMKSAAADYQFVSYPGVKHGFTNPAATERGQKYQMPLAYDEHADRDSYAKTVALIRG